MGHIFISYSKQDKDYATKLFNALHKRGLAAWMDVKLRPGEQWDEVIEGQINACDIFILIVSENSKNSRWVKKELLHAQDKNKPIFPLLLKGSRWMLIQDLNCVDVAGGTLPDESFFEEVKRIVQKNTPLPAAPHTPPPAQSARPAPKPIHAKRSDFKIQNLAVIGGSILLLLLCAGFGINYWINLPAAAETPTKIIANSPVPSATEVVLVPTATQISSTNTPDPTPIPTLGIGSSIESGGVPMMYVPEGNFSMGSDTNSDEKPIHSVNLDAYYIDKYEVTNAAYKRCVGAGKCTPPKQSKSYTRASYYGNPEFDEYPVIYVDWNMAKTYCEWRDSRLPTEAEWEKAAKGSDGRTYPWGNDAPNKDLLNYNGNIGDTAKVGGYEGGVSPYGVYDMAGNVWEWVNDWYDGAYYQNSPSSNPSGPSSGTSRVLRGGSWNLIDTVVRSAVRLNGTPDFISNLVGFRCARSLP